MHQQNSKNRQLYQYTFFGILFGLCFPLLAAAIESFLKNKDYFDVLIGETSHLMLIIDTAPFVLGFVFYNIGKKQRKISLFLSSLENETQYLKEALDQASIISMTDPQGIITYVNHAFCDLSGYTKDELIGNTFEIIHSGKMHKDFNSKMWETLKSGHVWKSEICYKNKKGEYYWIHSTIVPAYDSQRKIIRYTSISHEITERKRIESELSTLAETQRAILEGATYSIISTNMEGVINIFNQAAEQMLGYKSHEIIGKKTPLLFHEPHEIEEKASSLSSELGTTISPGFDVFTAKARLGHVDESEWVYIRKNGTKFPIKLSMTALYEKQDQVTGFLAIAQDITENKKIQAELVTSKEAAISATNAKSTFLANMSHEIRTPMNGIIGMVNLLLGSIDNPQHLEKLRIIQNCGNSLLDIINDILDFSKLEVNKLELENEPFNLHECVNEIIELLNTKASEKGISLTYKKNPDCPSWITGDVTRFRQVVTNLIVNGIKFTKKGGVTIYSASQLLSDNLYEFKFSIKDTGVGIPEDIKNKLFQSFSQADASTTRKYGGTGLGLAICKGICEKMGGSVWVESKIGEGSTFSFTFKASKTDKIVPQSSNPFAIVDPEMGSKNPLRILVAEDNRVNQMVILGLLSKLGYQADTVANGEEVLDNLFMKSYDLILMDCHMPIMDGFAAAKIIVERYPEGKRPRIVAVTASTMKEDIERCFECGMDDFVGKPITVQSLLNTLLRSKALAKIPSSQNKEQHSNTLSYSHPFDQEKFMSNFSGIEDIAVDAINTFIKSYPRMIIAIEEALQAKSPRSLEIAAHTIKGAVSNFYAEPSRLLAWKLEQMGHGNTLDGAHDILINLKNEILNLQSALMEIENMRCSA